MNIWLELQSSSVCDIDSAVPQILQVWHAQAYHSMLRLTIRAGCFTKAATCGTTHLRTLHSCFGTAAADRTSLQRFDSSAVQHTCANDAGPSEGVTAVCASAGVASDAVPRSSAASTCTAPSAGFTAACCALAAPHDPAN